MFDYAESPISTQRRFCISELTSNVPYAVRSTLQNVGKKIRIISVVCKTRAKTNKPRRCYIYRIKYTLYSVGAYFCRGSCCGVLSDSRSKRSRSKQNKNCDNEQISRQQWLIVHNYQISNLCACRFAQIIGVYLELQAAHTCTHVNEIKILTS